MGKAMGGMADVLLGNPATASQLGLPSFGLQVEPALPQPIAFTPINSSRIRSGRQCFGALSGRSPAAAGSGDSEPGHRPADSEHRATKLSFFSFNW